MLLKHTTKAGLLMGLFMCNALGFAQSPVGFVKKVYADHLNEDLMGVDTIKLHAAPELRRLIEKRDKIADANEGEMCAWVDDAYPLIPGNDFDTKLNQMTFTALANGHVRAQGLNFGKRFQVEFQVSCVSDACKIENLYTPQNYKTRMAQIVRAGKC